MKLVCYNELKGRFTVGRTYKVLCWDREGMELIDDSGDQHTVTIRKDDFDNNYKTWFKPPYLK